MSKILSIFISQCLNLIVNFDIFQSFLWRGSFHRHWKYSSSSCGALYWSCRLQKFEFCRTDCYKWPRWVIPQTRLTLEEIVNPDRFSAGLVFSVHASGRMRIKTPRFGRVSGGFEWELWTENFWIRRVLPCKRFSSRIRIFFRQWTFEFGVAQNGGSSNVVRVVVTSMAIDSYWWQSVVASFCYRSRQPFVMGNAAFLTNQNYRRKQCWLPLHDPRPGRFWIRTRQMPDWTTWLATIA